MNATCEKFSELGDNFNKFLDYFKSQWMIYFNNGMLNYSGLSKSQRSNSYIENYNRIIKLKLSKFLYGKNRCKITWPIFFYFIKNEENDKQNEINALQNKIEEKINTKKCAKDNTNNKEGNSEDNDNLNKNKKNDNYSAQRNWLKYNDFSCRHDTFFLIYTFIIYNELKVVNDDDIIKSYNTIAKELLKMNLSELNNGIWPIISKFKNNKLDLTKIGYKAFYTVMQHIENFRNKDYFCIKYNLIEGCSNINCTKTDIKIEYFSPSINYNEEYWIQYEIPDMLDYLFRNINSYCVKCQWKNGVPDKKSSPKYFKNYTNITLPLFIFISFEDNLNDRFSNYLINNEAVSENKLNNLLFNKLKDNIKYIEHIIVEKFEYANNKYKLRGIISMPSDDHYAAILIDLQNSSFLMEKGKSYYYNDRMNNNEITYLENWKSILRNEVPILALYEKES